MIAEGYVLGTGVATGLPEDLVAQVAEALETWGADLGPAGKDVVARALLAERAWSDRQAAEERAHARRRDDAVRLPEAQVIAEQCEARRRAREHAAGVMFADTGAIRATRHS